jgi:hypothetical protein
MSYVDVGGVKTWYLPHGHHRADPNRGRTRTGTPKDH